MCVCRSLGMNIGEGTYSVLLLRNLSQVAIKRIPCYVLHIPVMIL